MFALGALILSLLMGAISYFTARHFLVSERESSSVHNALTNAANVEQMLSPTRVLQRQSLLTVLAVADSGISQSHSLLQWKGEWYDRSATMSPRAISASLTALVDHGTVATQTYALPARLGKAIGGQPVIAVGVPLPEVHAAYYELFQIGDLGRTLNVLALALFGAGLVTTLLGAALGRWASARSLRPLGGVSRAAVAIAGGQLDTRLTASAGDRDLVALTRSFNRMVDQLQERIEHEARFASDVSHELRSPLTTLSTSLEVLEAQSPQLSTSGRQALALLAADLRRFQRMVADLLEISRSDAHANDASFEEVDPGELVTRAVAAAQRTLPAGSRPPTVEVAGGVAGTRLSVDKRRFERIITNLLENASLYGGGATVVRVETAPPVDGHPRAVRVSVEDTGPGLPASERSKVFERFYRGQTAYRRGAGTGTGLGLALVAEHARLHGGSVWADESAGGGARFVVELPAEAAEDADEAPEHADEAPEPAARATPESGRVVDGQR